MKKFSLLVLFMVLCVGCSQKKQEENLEQQAAQDQSIEVTDIMMESAVIYEANIRQYSEEGTFEAFTKDIPTLKAMGVKIIWVMPINPISKIKRKATGDKFTSEFPEEEQKKYLGSYYSVSDYKAVNPEFGTLEDFKKLVNSAHDNGIYVIIDWVPNHTGWDHPWINEHPEWYTQNEKGEIIDPINPDTGTSWGWTDVADLNYDNQDMRREMIADMKFWVKEADIDGFRMDVAHKVPPAFFKEAIAEMEKVKPLFMLAEAEQPDLFQHGFDMHYAWEGHHLLNKIAKGDADASDFKNYIEKQNTVLRDQDFSLNFVTNHDENSWAGTLKERMPESKDLFTALTYTMPGMPLIYSGQEYDLDHRLKFFEKDEIPKSKSDYFDLLVQLGRLKNTSSALHGGKSKASFEFIEVQNNKVVAFTRSKNGSKLTFVANVSNQGLKTNLPLTGSYLDYLANEKIELSGEREAFSLEPWEFKILIH